MKILYLIDSLSGGGAEKLMHDILPRIKENHECEILLLTQKNDKYSFDLESKGISVHKIPFKGHFCRIFYIQKYIRKNSFDIVHANLFPIIYYCSIAKKITKNMFPVLVMTEHSTDNHRRYLRWINPLEKWIYSSYDHVISISDKTQETLFQWIHPKNKDKYSVICNGVPLDEFRNAKVLNRKYLIPEIAEDEIILCIIGSFTEQKGHSFMLDVMTRLPEKYHLVCLGEGPLLNQIQHKTELLHLEKRVHFLGFRRDVADVLNTVDISVIPSKWEGFGLVAVEAMACDTPIVATDVPGLSEVIGDVGVKIPYGKVDLFANAILHVNLNKDQTNEKKRAKNYDIDFMVEKYIAVYTRCLKEQEDRKPDIKRERKGNFRMEKFDTMDKSVVLEIASMDGRYGIENYIMNMLRQFDHKLVQIDFLSPAPGPFDQEIEAYGGRFFRITPWGMSIKNIKKHYSELSLIFREHPEITTVHIHGNTAVGCLDAYIAKKSGISKIIVHSHSDGVASLRGKILHVLSRAIIQEKITHKFCCSNAAGQWMFGKKGNYSVMKNAIFLDKFRYSPELSKQIHMELGIENCKIIGHVGRMETPKNHIFLLNIFKSIITSHPEARLMFVGDGSLSFKITDTAKEMGLTDKIIHIKDCDCVEKMLQAMDVFVFPSLWEGLGIALIEAQASGLNCVVSDVINDEVCVTDLVEKHSLKDTADSWAEYIWAAACKSDSRSSDKYIELLRAAGYDVVYAARKLQDLYTEK